MELMKLNNLNTKIKDEFEQSSEQLNLLSEIQKKFNNTTNIGGTSSSNPDIIPKALKPRNPRMKKHSGASKSKDKAGNSID